MMPARSRGAGGGPHPIGMGHVSTLRVLPLSFHPGTRAGSHAFPRVPKSLEADPGDLNR